MINFTQITFIIGHSSTNGVQMLGTGFLISTDGKIVTPRHVIGNIFNGLCILMPNISYINEYQDANPTTCNYKYATIYAIDPIHDICILKSEFNYNEELPKLDNLDNIDVGNKIGMFGFPHCVMGRRVLTYRESEIGAKMLLETSGIKSKYASVNIQTRPGQSGSLVLNLKNKNIVGMLIGTYAPSCSVTIDGINPHELNQDSYCICASYIKEML